MSTELHSFADDLTAVFCSCARQTLRGALGRACGMTPGERLPGPSAAFPLAIRFTLSEGGKGEISLLLAREAGALLADLMVMGDGGATWTEEHRDALQELGSQLAGAFTTSQTERWSQRLVFRASVGEGAPAPGSCCYPVEMDVQGFPAHSAVLTISQELMATASELDRARSSQSDFARTDDFTEGISEAAPAAAPARAPAGGSGSATSWVDSRDPSVQRLLDVPIEVIIELGQTELSIRRILEIGPGSIIELDRMAGEPVDLVVNDKVIARGEVVVIEENFGIRITTLVTPEERARPTK
ncbi:MAG TPA: flagellar motor switch protein FliN [Fibrobacteria bacterium]|nr:flagellar motor switch protein FliN [Fibrobacteria bacterium]